MASSVTVRRQVVKRQPRRAASMPAAAAPRIPRISRLMALAIRFDEMLSAGEVTSHAELARLGHVSPARISQIMGLLNLAPAIQEALLWLPAVDGAETVTERQLRGVAAVVGWARQEQIWSGLTTALD